MPHDCLTYGLRLIGSLARIYNMVASIYVHSTGVYGDIRFPLRRGIKEGCPCHQPFLFWRMRPSTRLSLGKFSNGNNSGLFQRHCHHLPEPM